MVKGLPLGGNVVKRAGSNPADSTGGNCVWFANHIRNVSSFFESRFNSCYHLRSKQLFLILQNHINKFHGVMVSTSGSESEDLGSIPSGTKKNFKKSYIF